MKSISKKRKRKPTKQTKPEPAQDGHRKAFDQLLDDAIFGVKKKNQRG